MHSTVSQVEQVVLRYEQMTMEPYLYTCSQPGKAIRTRLVDAFNFWIQAEDSAVERVKRVIEHLHNGSLIIDDIEDGAVERRGRPCAHVRFGLARALNAGNAAYFLALDEANRLHGTEAVAVFAEECLNLHRGQGAEIYFRDCCLLPTEEDYFYIVGNKTGGLFRLAARLLLSVKPHAHGELLVALADRLGTLYQMRDDYLNLFGRDPQSAEFADDLCEGKFTLPIIHGCADATPGTLVHIKCVTMEERIRTVQRLKTTQSDIYTLERMREVEVFIRSLVSRIHAKNEQFEWLLASLMVT